MTRPTPRTLTEHAQRLELADGNRDRAARLRQIDELLNQIHYELAAVRGRAARYADQIGLAGANVDVRVQTSATETSPQAEAVDWLESAPAVLRDLKRDVRTRLADLMG